MSDEKNDNLSVDIEEARARTWTGMLTASMNVRYHRLLATWAGRIDGVLRIVAAIAASGTVASSTFWSTQVGQVVWVTFSLCAAVSAVALATLPLKKWENANAELAKSWA